MDDNRSEAGVILGLPILIRQSRVEEILGISRGNLPKYMVPEPVYVRPQQWRLQDVELWARSTGKRRLEVTGAREDVSR
jgi:hypothetical protein